MPYSDTIELARALIQRPSVTPDDQGCQQLLAERLNAIGFDCESMRIEDVDNLWAIRTPAGAENKPLFVFAGHTDVVPTGPEAQWRFPPFAAEIADEMLHGRGAADMKGSIAAMVTAVERFIAEHPDHAGRIGFLITSDEEGPALNGTKAVMDTLTARGEKIDFCLVGEPSSTEKLGDVIKVGRRGSLSGTLRILGKQGHIAYPHLADNAIHSALPLLNALTQIEWDQGNDQFPPTSLQISNIHAGTGANNVIPGNVEVLFNLRFSPEISAENIQARVDQIIASHSVKTELEWHLSGLPFQTRGGSLVSAIENAVKKICGYRPERSTSGGTSDGRFIAPTGCQVVELGPSNATIHQIDECVSTQALDDLSLIYEELLLSLLK